MLVAQIAETPGNLREEALELAQGNLLPWALTKVFKQRPDMCDRAAVEHALERARAEESDWLRAEMLGDLVPLLDAPLRANVLSEGISAALAVESEGYRAQALAALCDHVAEPYKSELLEQGLLSAIRERVHCSTVCKEILMLLARQSDRGLRNEALAAVDAVEHPGQKALALAAFAPAFERPECGGLIDQGLIGAGREDAGVAA